MAFMDAFITSQQRSVSFLKQQGPNLHLLRLCLAQLRKQKPKTAALLMRISQDRKIVINNDAFPLRLVKHLQHVDSHLVEG